VNMGEQWGATDVVREWLTGGAGRQRGPVVSGGVRERVRKSKAVRQRGADRRAQQHSASRLSFKPGFKPIQKYSNSSNEIQIPPNFGCFKR
jgi:hypothetical protein